MEPLFQQVVMGVVPQPVSMPPAPFDPEDLHAAFREASRSHAYQQFQLLPGGAGAQFMNAPDDGVVIQLGLVQIRYPVRSTALSAREDCVAILRAISRRLNFTNFLQVGIKVVAYVPTPGSAQAFVAERLMQAGDSAGELGPNFFAGGVKYRSPPSPGQPDETLLIEPLVQDDALLYVDYDTQRLQAGPVLEQIGAWLDASFEFLQGPVTAMLERGA